MAKIKTPIIAINYKTYLSATGKRSLALTKMCCEVAKQKKVSIIVAVQTADIAQNTQRYKRIPIFAQHISDIAVGAHTGHVLAESVKQAGAVGTLLNHSEHQLPMKKLAAAVLRAREAGLSIIICASTIAMAKAVAKLKPDFVAYEPPELIGGTVSVTTKPHVILKMVHAVRSVNRRVGILVGAGVKTGQDVKIALRLKTQGVLLASGVAASKTPRKALLDLVSGLK
jgi:triosephosphate isomerase (TIM)